MQNEPGVLADPRKENPRWCRALVVDDVADQVAIIKADKQTALFMAALVRGSGKPAQRVAVESWRLDGHEECLTRRPWWEVDGSVYFDRHGVMVMWPNERRVERRPSDCSNATTRLTAWSATSG